MKEFNVLNHGDCWNFNIMFHYDAFGKIKETLFVDFQVGKYGSPANDLYYLILSSAAPDIKINKFDYLVRYYFDNLIENLKLLQYHRPLPKLKNIQAALFRNGLAGKSTRLKSSKLVCNTFVAFSLYGRLQSVARSYAGEERERKLGKLSEWWRQSEDRYVYQSKICSSNDGASAVVG